MYITNWDQISTQETWFEQILLTADDDDTPIGNDQVTIWLQVYAHSQRGGGDQSQYGNNGLVAFVAGTTSQNIPIISCNTDDNTGMITLDDGVININIDMIGPLFTPGMFEVGLLIVSKPDNIKQQLSVGLMPIYVGGTGPVA